MNRKSPRVTAAIAVGPVKKAARASTKPIVIKGCTAWFDGIYDIDHVFFKLLTFIVVVCVLALICL